MVTDLLLVSGGALLAAAALMVAGAVVAARTGRFTVVDTLWGLGFVAVAWVAAAIGDGDLARRLLLAVLVSAWGLRLAWHMHRRNAGTEDARYEEYLEGAGFWKRVRKVFVTQGAALWFVSLPVQASAVAGAGWWPVAALGVALWLVGVLFEAVGDRQLARFKADPANKGVIMDRGLWAWTRHPNYFGDACVWWGIWIIAASAWPSVLTLLSPIAMTYFLVYATGARRLERHMADRPGWAEYAARTSFFLPRPPRRSPTRRGAARQG